MVIGSPCVDGKNRGIEQLGGRSIAGCRREKGLDKRHRRIEGTTAPQFCHRDFVARLLYKTLRNALGDEASHCFNPFTKIALGIIFKSCRPQAPLYVQEIGIVFWGLLPRQPTITRRGVMLVQ